MSAPNWKSRVETVRLVFELRQNSNRVNAALFPSIFELGFNRFSNVNTCVYDVLVTWPRVPMYLPIPPKTGRTTAWPAANSPAVGE
jgi:hypothetical protein